MASTARAVVAMSAAIRATKPTNVIPVAPVDAGFLSCMSVFPEGAEPIRHGAGSSAALLIESGARSNKPEAGAALTALKRIEHALIGR